MAITCDLTMNTYGGLELPEAYIRVSQAETFKVNVEPDPEKPRDERQFVRLSAGIYMDEQARLDGKNPLDIAAATFEWDTAAQPNILSACYDHLKAQDTYAQAIDC